LIPLLGPPGPPPGEGGTPTPLGWVRPEPPHPWVLKRSLTLTLDVAITAHKYFGFGGRARMTLCFSSMCDVVCVFFPPVVCQHPAPGFPPCPTTKNQSSLSSGQRSSPLTKHCHQGQYVHIQQVDGMRSKALPTLPELNFFTSHVQYYRQVCPLSVWVSKSLQKRFYFRIEFGDILLAFNFQWARLKLIN